jgi:hypothetical protein
VPLIFDAALIGFRAPLVVRILVRRFVLEAGPLLGDDL